MPKQAFYTVVDAMQMFNQTITLFCRFGPPKADAFARAVIYGVSMDSAAANNRSLHYAKSADRALILIPFSAAEGYVAAHIWQTMTPAARKNHWSLQPGDIVVEGVATLADGESAAALLTRTKSFLITTVDEKQTHDAMAHFAIGCGRTYRYGGGVA
ncbi:MAG: hypothetical protein RSD01_04280 [Ruthenibacterium sp.]